MLRWAISTKNDCVCRPRGRPISHAVLIAVRDQRGEIMPIPGEMLRRGWGVLRLKPWHLAGVFASSVEAEKLAHALGAGYTVKYGEHAPGSSDFDFANATDTPSV
jgi:hypothetical protein